MGSPSNSSPISGSSLRRCLSCLRPPCRCHKTLLKLTKQRVKSWCNYTSMNELVPSFLTKSPKLKLVLRNAISTTISLDLMVMQTLATLQVAARSGASRGHEPRRYRLRCSVRKSPSAVSRGPDRLQARRGNRPHRTSLQPHALSRLTAAVRRATEIAASSAGSREWRWARVP